MKKLIACFLCALACGSSAFATLSPYDIFLTQENSTNDGQFTNFLTFGADGLFGFDIITHKPMPIVIGSGLSLDTSLWVLSASSPAKSFNLAPSHTIQTVAAAANGWQIDSTRDSDVNYSVTVTTTASIAGNAAGYVVLEIAATNSATASDWTEVARTGNSQTLSLAITLQSVQGVPAQLHAIVPGGSYTRLRSVTSSGTVTFVFNSGEEVKL